MEEQLEEIFRRCVEAVNRAELDPALPVIDPEIEFIPARAAVQGAYHRHDGVRKFFRDNEENFDLFRATYPDLRHIARDRMVALGSVRIRGKASGVEAEVPSSVILDFREGRLLRFEDVGDPQTALTMAGARD